ncbi:cell wall beta-glucosidase Psu2 [Schizosaccharomyces osmophilus]|uniref:Cell wall beta-glucosidase Psu2 n=1 Tax=Schizosaccharomyces osmophilus TaxID=2545709 RepID=A0AAE9W5E2_9SCHI|nr:cell wall beta-glucosidase Psu2 [Schizosaccharomyces osmophilus]WBW70586.1 cell wall beta-glucosidase Psu2 [Schizosaccharomyces osmophilus]
MLFSKLLVSAISLVPLASAVPVGNVQGHRHHNQTAIKRDGGGFQDGVYDCSHFPEDQDGVVKLDYLGFGGWTGVQKNDGTFGTASTCQENTYCSYACKPGMSKTQWPSSQPSNGESVGGLICKNGKLHKTQQNSNNLCEGGSGNAYVKNTLGSNVAICRTDYPGTENMNVPTDIGAGSQQPLSVVDEDNYYNWGNKKTSAQYYVNKSGRSAQDVCVWGNEGDDFGNWAPLNFGSGLTDGKIWLSMSKNPLNSQSNVDYKISIKADGGTLSNDCKYENGSFHGSGATSDGCTVSVTGGGAYFELSN